jgi:hypothetical protein
MLELPFAPRRASRFPRASPHDIIILGGDLLIQALRHALQPIAMLVDHAGLYWHTVHRPRPWRAIDDEELGPPQPTPEEIVEQGRSDNTGCR